MEELPLKMSNGTILTDIDPDALFLRVTDVDGTYTIPFIQTSRKLVVTVLRKINVCAKIRMRLKLDTTTILEKQVDNVAGKSVSFENRDAGDYVLVADFLDTNGNEMYQYEIGHIGIGIVAFAIGDSLTEGFLGHGFMTGPHRTARDFPLDAVSKDGRNFPQFAPTAYKDFPTANCFQSWMTDLNNYLSASLNQPVFIANEGWGGYTTEDYLRLIRTDAGWQERAKLLSPNLWLLHLGVNDERAQVSPAKMIENLKEIIKHLINNYGAQPERILVAKPSYDYWHGAELFLSAYCQEIDKLIDDMRLGSGPDFFTVFSKDREKWYGQDPVHPGQAGMNYMAKLWHDAVMAAFK